LSGNYGSIVWSTPNDDSSDVLALDDEAFARAVQAAFTSHSVAPTNKQRSAGAGRLGSDIWQAYNQILDATTNLVESLSSSAYLLLCADSNKHLK